MLNRKILTDSSPIVITTTWTSTRTFQLQNLTIKLNKALSINEILIGLREPFKHKPDFLKLVFPQYFCCSNPATTLYEEHEKLLEIIALFRCPWIQSLTFPLTYPTSLQ